MAAFGVIFIWLVRGRALISWFSQNLNKVRYDLLVRIRRWPFFDLVVSSLALFKGNRAHQLVANRISFGSRLQTTSASLRFTTVF